MQRIRITIPRKENGHRTSRFDRAMCCTPNQLERLIDWLKQLRRLAARYEKRAEKCRAVCTIQPHCCASSFAKTP